MLAYEHGAEYPDTHIAFHSEIKGDNLGMKVCAKKGNYYNGEIIDEKHVFITPWFHIAAVSGNSHELFKHYRTFLLKYICEYQEARKPYIYYNTWNNQERDNYFKGKTFLDCVNLERTLEEIDAAHEMGIDVYVIDTGWFTKAGDWLVNTDRFPDGLAQVKQKLSDYGMKLGLWFNPMIAAGASETYKNNMEYRLTQNGKEVPNISWEKEQNYYMCLASGYSDVFIKKMLELHDKLGVTYFKWDGVHQYGCESPDHNHGNETNTKEERLDCYSYKMGMEMIRIVEEVTKQCPEIIVDFDVTEEGRFVGLGFLSVGKYFLVNNGPYAMDFDLPEKFEVKSNQVASNLNPFTNIFFYPGPARTRFCRQGIKYDFFAPSILFLTHFLPDAPVLNQNNSLAAIVLGGNGIWGDLLHLSKENVQLYADTLGRYKEVAQYVTESYPVTKGYIGSSPEVYEKIDPQATKGLLCFFTHVKGSYTYFTQKINKDEFSGVYGADSYEITEDGRIKLTVKLNENDARIVFVK
jgi:alpha-galactosidase